jgi:glucoamylase
VRGLARFLAGAAGVILVGAALLVSPAAAQDQAAGSSWSASSAPDGPGATSYLDLGRKDCLGSATSLRSRVWYTVADGVLSDVYSSALLGGHSVCVAG